MTIILEFMIASLKYTVYEFQGKREKTSVYLIYATHTVKHCDLLCISYNSNCLRLNLQIHFFSNL